MSRHITSSLQIIGLMIVTLGIALVIGMFIPKQTQAPSEQVSINQVETETTNSETAGVISFDALKDNDHVQPKQIITGKVPGYWFFEGSFPVELKNASGQTFATVIAKTNQDWMVTTNIAFSITLPDEFTYHGVGSILFKRDDPSDGEAPKKPQDEKSIPVIFEN